ncbi:GTP-binding protein [Alkalicoccus daliensis]|uniref:GTPase, G3E family n=1 Tax=Alkalicoccus daliensis TaxID=745820 RepID=A0A1G9Z9G4_9BACI|nr:GTP-binding protein [Alkalicoccus daliensis]SDN17990.1 GTPase, G3E family [Alkalicoccus daliensis]
MTKKIPVTVLSGYLGAGKTTLLNYLLHQAQEMKAAVIVNDMSEINIDAALVKQGGFSRSEEKLVEMQNGCICCTLREDLVIEVEKLVRAGDIDYILIESSGISEPIPVAQTFTYMDEELGIDLSSLCQLDTLVTVVDANRFWEDFSSGESLLDRAQTADEEDEREIADLLIDQIEFANTLVLNKIDLLSEENRRKLEGVLKKLNPEAELLESRYSQVPLDSILNTGRFDLEKVSQGAGWIKELNEEHVPETEEYGISSFVYKRNRPFHPGRWMKWLERWPEDIIRSKGFFWLASRNETAGLLSQAGTSLTIEAAGSWVAAYPEEERAALLKEDPELLSVWDPVYGDRITELVFIGLKLNQKEVEKELDTCLLTDKEMQESWQKYEDPLPAFQ